MRYLRLIAGLMLLVLTGCYSTQSTYRGTPPDDKGGFACIVFLACLL